jgi:hypothetical protein
MKYTFLIPSLAFLLSLNNPTHAQNVKFDSTVKVGRVGYRVYCKNKHGEENRLEVKLIGFENTAREPNFFIRGWVAKATIDDLNNDGYPDLILYIYTDSAGLFGTVYAFVSEQNKSIVPFALQDIMANGKLSEGYKGHDEFSLMEGSLFQKFPLYKPGDDKDKPLGAKGLYNTRWHLKLRANINLKSCNLTT